MQQVNVRGISPLAITRMCVMVDATSAILLSTQSINQPINQMRSSQHRGTPQHRSRRQGDLPQVWRASRIMPVSISGHFGPARARTCNGQENTAQTLPLNVVPPVPGYQCSPALENYHGKCYPASAVPSIASLPAEAIIHHHYCMYVSRRTPAWNALHVCRYAICTCCSCPASTTSATSSNSRVLTRRLAVCSRSELLHRGKLIPLSLPETRILSVAMRLPEADLSLRP